MVKNDDRAPGLECYCYKQIGLWSSLSTLADDRFTDILGHRPTTSNLPDAE